MKRMLLLMLPAVMYADSLQSLLSYAANNNELIASKKLSKQSKQSELESSKSNYYPTIDLGGFYQRSDEPSPFAPGTIASAYAKVAFDVYDGGKKSYTTKQKTDEFSSSQYNLEATKKDMQLAIVQDFYNIKNTLAQLKALDDSSKAVKAQLERMKKFFDAKLATSDDVDRLQSAYDKNIYLLQSVKFQLVSLQKALEIKVGKKIDSLDDSKFTKTDLALADDLDAIKALKSTQSSILNTAETIDSYYYPQIRLEDTYSFYGYQDEPSFGGKPIDLIENQNVLMATVNMKLFDFGTLGEQKEAVQLNANALSKQISYKTKEQKMEQELAISRITTAKLNIKSARSALKAATSALETITQKYNNQIVDNVVYLDALSSQTEAKSTYESSLNNLEIAYALYYYYNAKNLEEFLND